MIFRNLCFSLPYDQWHLHTLFPSTRTLFPMKGNRHISYRCGRGPSLFLSTDMARWWSHKISCIFAAINHMATRNADIKRSQAALEKRDVVLQLNVVWRGVRSDQKLLMVNEGKEDGWRAVSQDQLYLRRY